MEKSRYPAVLFVAALAVVSTLYLNSLIAVRDVRPPSAVVSELSSSRYLDNVKYLAGDAMKGRGNGTPELDRAADYIAAQFKAWGLKPMGDNGTYFQSFEITTGAEIGPHNQLQVGSSDLRMNDDFSPIMFSTSGTVDAQPVFAGYGITAPELNYDDYAGIDGGGKVVVVLRQSADPQNTTRFARHATLIDRAINAKQHGAAGIIFINDPEHADETVAHASRTDETADLGIPAVYAKPDAFIAAFKAAGKDIVSLERKMDADRKPQSFEVPAARVHLVADVVRTRKTVRNVLGAVTGTSTMLQNEWVVVGAHYDHLGLGDQNSLAPSQIGQIHHGADDNASGTAGVLELARLTAENRHAWQRSILFITFAGEELGLFGSSNFVNHPTIPLKNVMTMINMDMIGRLNNDRLLIGGVGTSPGFKPWLEDLSKPEHLRIEYSESGYDSSDHMSFNAKRVPVLFFFSGLHSDYHKPSDTADKINAAGAVRILSLVYLTMDKISSSPVRLEYAEVQQPQRNGSNSSGSGYGPYFGSVPDFRDDLKGVLFADVQTGSPAAKAGLKQGDLLVQFDGKPVQNLYDFFYALSPKKPGDVVAVVVKRNGQDVKASVTLEARR